MFRLASSPWATACAGLALCTVFAAPRVVRACGCVSPPVPDEVADFAVNQQAEQIIFEVNDGLVHAHVLIRFAGDPAQFAWIVPVPNVVDVQLSETMAFPLLDEITQPRIVIESQNHCPDHDFICKYHPPAQCPDHDDGNFEGEDEGGDDGEDADADNEGGDNDEDSNSVDGIDVDLQKQIGAYDVVAFSADEAELAVAWLQANGFIVNDSMTPYMKPYVERGMHFIAAKLIPGAGVDLIRPLKLTYEGEHPMIPLRLTAVAAEPHMPILAYIYGPITYGPMLAPIVDIPASQLQFTGSRGHNYAALMGRSLDAMGGLGFVAEYAGAPQVPRLNQDDYCCTPDYDICGLGGDGRCQCPLSEFDAMDCEQFEGLAEGLSLLTQLRDSHAAFTRLRTQLSPEEMTSDPMFAPRTYDLRGPLTLSGTQLAVGRCRDDVLDKTALANIDNLQKCAVVYCGTGQCSWTTEGIAGCECDPGSTARTHIDLDGRRAVTCVPQIPTVDLGLDHDIPDVCAGVDCGNGECLDVGGFPSCVCVPGQVAVLRPDPGLPLRCEAVAGTSGGPGAANFSEHYRSLDICAPKPHSCGSTGWLVANPNIDRKGATCAQNQPAAEEFIIPPSPTCGPGDSEEGSSGQDSSTSSMESDSGDEGRRGCAIGVPRAAPHRGAWARLVGF